MKEKIISILGAAVIVLVAAAAVADSEYKVSEIKKDAYKVGVKYKAEVGVGLEKHARLYVVARGGWKVNGKFPWKVEVTPPAGATMGKTTFKKDDAKVLDDHKAVFKLPYKVESPGTHEFKAKVKLSVCKGTTQCIFPTETLKWTVAAKGE